MGQRTSDCRPTRPETRKKEIGEQPEQPCKPCSEEIEEPVFHHSYPRCLFQEICEAFELQAILDLTPGDGELAMFAYRNNIMYTGLCMTKVHCEKLHARLFQLIRSAMLDDGDKLFSPRLQAILQKSLWGGRQQPGCAHQYS